MHTAHCPLHTHKRMFVANVLTGIFGAVIVLLLVLYIYLTWHFNYWKKRGVAGPEPRPYLGTYPKSSTYQKNTNFLLEADEIYRCVIIIVIIFESNGTKIYFFFSSTENIVINIASLVRMNSVHQYCSFWIRL